MDWKNSRWLRTIRRFFTIFITGAAASIMLQTGYTKEELIIVMITAAVCGLEKYIRDTKPAVTGENTQGE